LVLTIFFL